MIGGAAYGTVSATRHIAAFGFFAPGIVKPIVAERASEYLYDHGIPAYPYSTEIPVVVLGAKYKYRWARAPA